MYAVLANCLFRECSRYLLRFLGEHLHFSFEIFLFSLSKDIPCIPFRSLEIFSKLFYFELLMRYDHGDLQLLHHIDKLIQRI